MLSSISGETKKYKSGSLWVEKLEIKLNISKYGEFICTWFYKKLIIAMRIGNVMIH
jgi:hypothetical protein